MKFRAGKHKVLRKDEQTGNKNNSAAALAALRRQLVGRGESQTTWW